MNLFFINNMKPLLLKPFILMTLLAILPSCSTQIWQVQNVAATKRHPQCNTCHLTAEPRKGQQLFAEGVEPSSICLKCHAYKENHHPVDFVPRETYYVTPGKAFPLFDGEIRCLTCHDPHGGPEFSETPKLLRGGPYADRREPCFKCHYRERYAEIDPHIMLDSDGRIQLVNGEPVCLICHAKTPNPAVDRTKDVKFRADVAFLCWRCHPPMPGEFFRYHFLDYPSRRTLTDMAKSEKEMKVIFPLVPRGRITCSTCHNPHQKEVMVHEEARSGADSFHRLRLPSPTICLACHPTK
jgi:predicted CXXCH cytochrome family protein